MKLYHGSTVRVEKPEFGLGNPYNDYGLGFYCTEDKDLAAEWACPTQKDGFVNCYEIDLDCENVFNLNDASGGILAWLSVLLRHRKFDISVSIMQQAKDFFLSLYPLELDRADIVIGYRADDAYFSFAKAFLDNRISVRQLEQAMRLGNLGQQVVIKSEKAFQQLTFLEAKQVYSSQWHEKRMARDFKARDHYKKEIAHGEFAPDDIFAIDFIRGVVSWDTMNTQ